MRGDFRVHYPDSPAFSQKWNIPSGVAGSVKMGEPTKAVDAAAASPYLGTVAIMVDGDGNTSQRFTGIAKADSNDTVAAAGTVQLFLPLPGILYKGKVKTSTTADTQAEVDALRGKRVLFDLTSTTWSIDAAASDAVANNVIIVDGDYLTNEVIFAVKASFLSFIISA